MKAVKCQQGVVRVDDIPEPAGSGVKVKVEAIGICGSDLSMMGSDFESDFVMGHEVSGTLADGRAVGIEPLIPCGQCDPCGRGDYNLCETGPAIVMGLGWNGAMSEVIEVPERCLVPLPTGLVTADACLMEPLAIAIHGLRIAGFRGDMNVGIIGAGTIGLCTVAAARDAGANVTLYARHDKQREIAAKLGAKIATPGGVNEQYDLVVEAAGSSSALDQSALLCKPGGTVLVLGTYWGGLHLQNSLVLAQKEARLVFAVMYSRSGVVRDFDLAASLLARRSEIAAQLITHRFALEAAPEAFAVAADRKSGSVKVVLQP
jgi:threonine dehydrogenase-like Zn-dependent dehydrogenase